MTQYIVRRFLLMVPTLFGVTLAVFLLIRLVPGDAIMARMTDAGNLDPRVIAQLRAEFGLDRPLYEQYVRWVWGALRGDLGLSLWTSDPVAANILKKIPVSAELAVLAMLVSILFAVPIGVVSAIRQDTIADYLGRLLSIGLLSIPGFWIGTLIIVLPAFWFRWAPPVGFVPFFEDPWKNLQQFLLPALALGSHSSGSVMRMTRSTLLEVLRQDFIRTAWAKGLRESMVISRHALKNALIPVITIWGLQFGNLLGGTVIMESIFSLPGVGRLTLDAISNRDYTQLQGNILFLSLVFLTVNLLVDITYAWLDPRIRYR